MKVKCVAPVNIAVIKYWGKRCEELNLPLNSSISVTLDVSDLCTKTTVSLRHDLAEDTITLNGIKESVSKNSRTRRCLNAVCKNPHKRKLNDEVGKPKCEIVTTNNFPTAAGLASSAAGYACLAKCLGNLYEVDEDLSIIARLGSGSASRSMKGGFVKWNKGERTDGLDSNAIQIADEHHWTDMRILILVVNSNKKPTGSTEGMRRSVQTSQLLKHRADSIVEDRVRDMEKAVTERDFKTFAEITMMESNQLHAICMDTYPPIVYMNDTSHEIVRLVSAFNETSVKAAYTFDAGPNAVLFTTLQHFEGLLATIIKHFPNTTQDMRSFINVDSSLIESLENKGVEILHLTAHVDALQRIIVTKPGPGATLVSHEEEE